MAGEQIEAYTHNFPYLTKRFGNFLKVLAGIAMWKDFWIGEGQNLWIESLDEKEVYWKSEAIIGSLQDS